MISVDRKPVEHQFRMAVDQLIVGHPKRILRAGHSVEVVRITGCYHELQVNLFGQVTHQLGNRLLFVISVSPQVAHQIEVEIVFRDIRNIERSVAGQ